MGESSFETLKKFIVEQSGVYGEEVTPDANAKAKLLRGIGKNVLAVFIFILNGCLNTSYCQDTTKRQDEIINSKAREVQVWITQPKIIPGLLPSYFEKEETIGSPYFSSNWMRGVLEFSDHRRIPQMNEYLYFNYDKVNIRLILINNENKMWSYPIDSISGFVLADSNNIYLFEKVLTLGDKFFVEPILKSGKGFSLYKRLITRIVKANYENLGYTSAGNKFDEYIDIYEYYLIYPDGVIIKKFYLGGKTLPKIYKDLSVRAKLDYLGKHLNTEQDLVSFIERINKLISITSD
jgi:hypothetical protein